MKYHALNLVYVKDGFDNHLFQTQNQDVYLYVPPSASEKKDFQELLSSSAGSREKSSNQRNCRNPWDQWKSCFEEK